MSCQLTSDIIKQGYVKIKSRKLGLWRTQWVMLCRASSKGPFRLDKFSNEKSSQHSDGISQHYVSLETVHSVNMLPSETRKHALVISFLDKGEQVVQMCTASDAETSSWLVALRDYSSMYSSTQLENADVFHAYLLPTPSLSFYGEYLVRVTSTYISLVDSIDGQTTVVTWPLNTLRRYGRDTTKVTLESGRSCPTGEGLFLLNSYQAEVLYHRIDSASRSLALAAQSGGSSGTLTYDSLNGTGAGMPGTVPRNLSLGVMDMGASPRQPVAPRGYSIPQERRGPLPPVPVRR